MIGILYKSLQSISLFVATKTAQHNITLNLQKLPTRKERLSNKDSHPLALRQASYLATASSYGECNVEFSLSVHQQNCTSC